MVFRTTILLLALAIKPAVAAAPLAEIVCDEREALLVRLERSHGAERQGQGMRGPDAVLEVWAVPSTGAWTIVQTYANGIACIVAMGESWEALRTSGDPA
jgi:hypothetical protein